MERGAVRCRAMLMLSPDDPPARALHTNMINFNEESNCSTCLQKGETINQLLKNAHFNYATYFHF